MSDVNPETITALKKAFEAQRKQIIKWLKELVSEGKTETKYDCAYLKWEDMSRYEVAGDISCWGRDIADTRSYYCTPGIFVDEQGVAITNAALVEVLTRAQTTNATTCLAFYSAGGKVDYLYKDNGALTVMTHEGLVVNVTMANNWAVKGKEVTAEAASKIDACLSEKTAQRFTYEDRDVWVIPHGGDSVKLLNYSKTDDIEGCSKMNIPLFTENLTSNLRPDLAERIGPTYLNSMTGIGNSESFMLDASTSTMSVVVAVDSANFMVLNYGGVGNHAKITYRRGMEIPLFSIRSPNLVERLSKVRLNSVKVCSDGKMVNLADVASKAGDYASKFGLAAGTDLSAPSDREMVNTIRMQVSIVPASEDGKPTEVREKIYDYQTRNDELPTALYSYHTSFGTTFTTAGQLAVTVQPCTVDESSSKISAFNLSVEASKKVVGDDATYTEADNQENIDAGFGMAIPLGVFGFPKVANATLMAQWPVTAAPMARAIAVPTAPMFDVAPIDTFFYGSRGDDDEEMPVYRSLGGESAEPPGELYASRMGLGTYQGEGRGVKNPNLTRRTDSNPTMTYNRFYSLDAPNGQSDRSLPPGMYSVTKAQVEKIVRMMDEMYTIAGNAHLLTDPEAVSVQKITAAEFEKTPYARMGVAPVEPVEPVTEEDGSEPAKRPRIEIERVKIPDMMMVDC